MRASKLDQRIGRLEGKAKGATEPLDITVTFIEPGTMRVTGAMKFRNGQWVRDEINPCPPHSTVSVVDPRNLE